MVAFSWYARRSAITAKPTCRVVEMASATAAPMSASAISSSPCREHVTALNGPIEEKAVCGLVSTTSSAYALAFASSCHGRHVMACLSPAAFVCRVLRPRCGVMTSSNARIMASPNSSCPTSLTCPKVSRRFSCTTNCVRRVISTTVCSLETASTRPSIMACTTIRRQGAGRRNSSISSNGMRTKICRAYVAPGRPNRSRLSERQIVGLIRRLSPICLGLTAFHDAVICRRTPN